MATVTLNYPSSVYIPVAIGCCAEVIVCLDPSWVSKTVSGSNLVIATIENAGRQLSGQANPTKNIRCNKVYQYVLTINLAQFLDDNNRVPYIPTCADINEINPYACSMQSVIDAIEALVSPSMFCLTPLTELPENPSQNCIISIIGAGGDPADGLYWYDGANWQLISPAGPQ